jgi:Domain of unknown function (DUF4129)
MRRFTELVAAWDDIFSLPLTWLLMIIGAIIGGLLWFFWPRWWNALARMRSRGGSRKGRKGRKTRDVSAEELDELSASDEELPEVEPVVFLALADRYAAEGRFAEAVRERLRAMVRELVDRGVITHRPGWTVTELAQEAGASRPPVAPSMRDASGIFSDIWYAKRPASSEHDGRMKALASQVHEAVVREP